jgi:antitoxin YefM
MASVAHIFLEEDLKKVLEQITDTSDTFIITRRYGKNMIVLPEEAYDILAETAYLMRSPANLKMLKEAIDEIEKGNTMEFEVPEDD